MANTAEKNKQYQAAKVFYLQALNQATNLPKSEEKASILKDLKLKVREMGMKVDLQPISIEVEGTSLNDIRERYKTTLTIQEPLKVIDSYAKSIMIPSIDQIKNICLKTPSIAFSIANITAQDNKGDELNANNRVDANMEFWMQYNHNLEAFCLRDILAIWMLLESNNIMNMENLISFIESKSNIFTVSDLNKLKRAIECFFAGDYISSLHILVPTFEALFLSISEGTSSFVSSVAHRSTKGSATTKTRTLSENFLNDPELHKIWTEDFCWLIKAYFFSEVSFRIRHKVCHGEIDFKECSKENCIITIFFFIRVISITKLSN